MIRNFTKTKDIPLPLKEITLTRGGKVMTQHVIKPSIYLVKESNTTQKYMEILRHGVVLKHARNCQVSHRGNTVLPARFPL